MSPGKIVVGTAALLALSLATPAGAQINGFGGTNWTLNSDPASQSVPTITSNVLQLATNVNTANSAFYDIPQYIGSFTASFVFQNLQANDAEGLVFALQNQGTNAVSAVGGNYLGFYGLSLATGIAFDISPQGGAGPGLGYAPTQVPGGGPGGYIKTGAVNFRGTNAIAVNISYANGVVTVTVTDVVTLATFSTNFVENLAGAVGGTTAYVGFTGGGTSFLALDVSSFIFTPGSQAPVTSSFPVVLSTSNVFDVTKLSGNESDGVIAYNPLIPSRLFVAANTNGPPGLFGSVSFNSATNWFEVSLANLPVGVDPALAYDGYGNLFMAYTDGSSSGTDVAVSTDNGLSFTLMTNLAPGHFTVDPRIAVGTGTAPGSVWVLYKDFSLRAGPLAAQGAAVTTNGIGNFGPVEIVPGSTNDCGFGDIAVGPAGQVMVAYQSLFDTNGAATLYVSVDADGLGPSPFAAPVVAARNAIGGNTVLPASPDGQGINAAAGLAWDTNPSSQQYGRVYLACVGQGAGDPNDTDIFLSSSMNSGATWGAQQRVNDDSGANSQFLPRVAVDPTDGALALSWYDCRNDLGVTYITNTVTITNITTNITTNIDTTSTPPTTNLTTNGITTNFTTNYPVLTNLSGTVDGIANHAAMIYGTVSLNGGVTFQPNVKITSDTTNGYKASLAYSYSPSDFGDYAGLAFYGGTFYPVWADNSGIKGLNPDGTNKDFDVVVAPVTLKGLADLSITSVLTNTTNVPQIGSELDYLLTVSNAGPSAVTAASVTDVFPPNVYVVTAYPTNGTNRTDYVLHGHTLTWPVGALPVGGTGTILVRTTAQGIGNATNLASITPGAGVADVLTNNNSTMLVSTIYGADLNLSITASPGPICFDLGSPAVTFTVTVSNQGPVSATGVLISNTLSENLVAEGVTFPSGDSYSTNPSQNSVTFDIGDMTNGQVVTVSLTAYAPISLASLGFGAATCDSVALGVIDPTITNNAAEAETQIVPPDLAIGMTGAPALLTVGDSVTYTINVTNLGPVPAFDVTVTDFLPPNLQLVSADVRKGTYTASPDGNVAGQTDIIATLNEPLLAGQSSLVIITATATSLGQLVNTAVAADAVPDENPANNLAAVVTAVLSPDMALGMTGTPDAMLVGQRVTYTMSVTNLGPVPASGVAVTNTLPANLSFVSASAPPGVSYGANQNVVTFNIGALAIGQSVALGLTATGIAAGPAADSAVVGDYLVDTSPANNTATVTTTVNPQPPPIANLLVTPGVTGVFITWTTPYNATAQVAYGLTAPTNVSYLNPTLTNRHAVLVTGLLPDTNYVFQARSVTSGVLATAGGAFSTTSSVTLGTTDANYSGPGWLTSGVADGIFGDNYRYVQGVGGYPTAFTTYTPNIPAPGLYDVSIWYPTKPGTFSSSTPMIANGGTNAVPVNVDQTINGGSWQPVVTGLYLTNGATGNLNIYDNSGDPTTSVVANGARWVYELSQDAPTNGTVPAWWSGFYFGTNVSGTNLAKGTGYSYFADYVFGADPTSTAVSSQLQFLVTPGSSTNMTVTFSPWQGGRIYQLQSSANPGIAAWVTLTNTPALNTNNGTGFFTFGKTPGAAIFYRLAVSLSPNQ